MTTVIYDGSFDGLLTSIFEVYEYRFNQVEIISDQNYHQENIFSEVHHAITDAEKAARVLKKVKENLGSKGVSRLLMVYFSEQINLEHLILTALQHSLKNPGQNILQDFGSDEILDIAKVCKSVSREVHRMHAFVRFEKLQDDVYFAKIEPDFNVLPLIISHFKNRYQDQKWMIFDLKRHYGIFYDLEKVEFFHPENPASQNFKKTEHLLHEEEVAYQKLWQRYFFKTNIPERKNLKLHHQSLPKRYWKYLTEKY